MLTGLAGWSTIVSGSSPVLFQSLDENLKCRRTSSFAWDVICHLVSSLHLCEWNLADSCFVWMQWLHMVTRENDFLSIDWALFLHTLWSDEWLLPPVHTEPQIYKKCMKEIHLTNHGLSHYRKKDTNTEMNWLRHFVSSLFFVCILLYNHVTRTEGTALTVCFHSHAANTTYLLTGVRDLERAWEPDLMSQEKEGLIAAEGTRATLEALTTRVRLNN